MELPPSDAAADIRRTNVEREATYLEFARLEAAAKRRVAQRARVVRDALASTPALAHELERRGVVDDDAARPHSPRALRGRLWNAYPAHRRNEEKITTTLR